MKKQIQEKLQEVEKQYGITILMACETGSRGWGFSSPDSDYDVRFIYCHNLDWYLSIADKKDTIECMAGDLDLVGWDIRKSLRLLLKSNASLFEKLQSPVLYMDKEGFTGEMMQLALSYFSCRAGLHHYSSMAARYRQLCQGAGEVKLKDYFYMIRTSLASLWIIEKQTVPPMQLERLLSLITDAALVRKIESLVELKGQVNEKYLCTKDAEIDAYIEVIMAYCKARSADFQKTAPAIEPLNQFFLKIIESQ